MSRSQGESSRALAALWFGNILLGVMAASIAGLWVYFNFFFTPEPRPEFTAKITAEVKERLSANSDAIFQEASSVAAEALPPLGEAFYAQASADYPQYMQTLDHQGVAYREKVQDIFLDKVKAQYRDYLRKHQQILTEEFPQHASPERVERLIREFEFAADKIVERYYLDEFQAEADKTVAYWREVKPLDPPGPYEPSLEEQLAVFATDWAVLSFTKEARQELTD